MFLFVPFASCPVSKHYWKETGSLIFIIFHQIFFALIGFSLSFPFSRLNSPSLASPLIQKILKCLDHLHDSSLRGVSSEGLQRMVQMFSILVSQERRQQRGSGCKLISASQLAYIDIVKGCLLLPVTRKQRQSLPRPGYSLNLYVARKNYCDSLVWLPV